MYSIHRAAFKDVLQTNSTAILYTLFVSWKDSSLAENGVTQIGFNVMERVKQTIN